MRVHLLPSVFQAAQETLGQDAQGPRDWMIRAQQPDSHQQEYNPGQDWQSEACQSQHQANVSRNLLLHAFSANLVVP